MNKAIVKSTVLVAALGAVLSLSACNVEKTQEGELPEVDVNAQSGQLPEYEVETADVDVGTQPATVEVPNVDVDVNTREATIPVPDVDVDMPEENDAAEETPAQ